MAGLAGILCNQDAFDDEENRRITGKHKPWTVSSAKQTPNAPDRTELFPARAAATRYLTEVSPTVAARQCTTPSAWERPRRSVRDCNCLPRGINRRPQPNIAISANLET